ncbi:ABC transporter ATP-binding protein/permease [uncultured Eubacterium sp.]|uniref:ABC transporter ATP-binding protein/permease n=1 Tax=uncultured Eubacterium sp. TaxID=165185 RepID=UPI0025E54142|nr:ABC transporter ATP-binding protein/permease [uncultured Eubacterium sp.]
MIKTRLIRLLNKSKKYIVYQVLWQYLSLICQILLIASAASLLGSLLDGTLDTTVLTIRAVTICICIALRVFCEYRVSRASYAASVHVKRILRTKIYEKLLRLGTSYREQVTTSEVVQMSAEGVEQLEIYFGKYLAQFFYSMTAPILLFVILCRVNWQASLVLLICVPLIPISIVAVQKIAKRLLNKYWGIYTGLGDSFLENLQGLTTLKIYRADEQKAKEMDVESQRFRQITMKVLTMQLNSTSVMDIVAYGGAAVGIIVALRQFFAGSLGFSGALMIILLASEFFIPLRLLGSFFHIAMNGMSASDKIFAFLDLPEPEPKEATLSGESLGIHMDHVSFSYEESRQILDDISLDIPAGSFVSLVGTSGCGKSTIAGLLMGRNRGYDGSISITQADGTTLELSDINETSLMQHITLVSHNSYLFKGTVEENLRMGKPDATKDELWSVLEQVNLKEFLVQNDGLQAPVAEKGSNFSGGQCQRLALARALLHDSPVYIFDEATSNIDMESEEQIMQVIHRLAVTKTIILISHRLANVVDSDVIYMLGKGKIVERGTHTALMADQGTYQHLYQTQCELEQYSTGEEAIR